MPQNTHISGHSKSIKQRFKEATRMLGENAVLLTE